jgi:anaerobic selenocysteine-containing dehydrogenase
MNGIANVIISEHLTDEQCIAEHTTGFDEFKAVIKKYTPERVAEIC